MGPACRFVVDWNLASRHGDTLPPKGYVRFELGVAVVESRFP